MDRLAAMETFVRVVETGSFSGAAKAVGVTQSAVTKSVADLEQQVGFAIFNRTSRGVAMTPEGRDFIDRAARLLADALEGQPGFHHC